MSFVSSKWIRRFSVCVLATVLATDLRAQDPHFSQYNETPIYINPALAGVAYDVRANLNYRCQ